MSENVVYKNQTELGKEFGISAVKVGNVLRKIGWKNEDKKGLPTEYALNNRIAKIERFKAANGFQYPTGVYDVDMVRKVLRSEGHEYNVDHFVRLVKSQHQDMMNMLETLNDTDVCKMMDGIFGFVPREIVDEVQERVFESV